MISLDTNIVLELLKQRRHFEAVALFLTYQLTDQKLAISSLTVSNLFYLAGRTKAEAVKLEKHLAQYDIYSASPEDVDWALKHYKRDDFEDALQVAAAIREGCTNFVTLDAGLAKKYRRHLNISLIQ